MERLLIIKMSKIMLRLAGLAITLGFLNGCSNQKLSITERVVPQEFSGGYYYYLPFYKPPVYEDIDDEYEIECE